MKKKKKKDKRTNQKKSSFVTTNDLVHKLISETCGLSKWKNTPCHNPYNEDLH